MPCRNALVWGGCQNALSLCKNQPCKIRKWRFTTAPPSIEKVHSTCVSRIVVSSTVQSVSMQCICVPETVCDSSEVCAVRGGEGNMAQRGNHGVGVAVAVAVAVAVWVCLCVYGQQIKKQ